MRSTPFAALALPLALALLAAPVVAKPPKPGELKPGEGYVALVYDTLQPLHGVEFNFNGKDKTVEVGGRFDAGKHLVVQALPAGRYCLEKFMATGGRWNQRDRLGTCFDVEAGQLSDGGTFMPRRYYTPDGVLDSVLRLSDPLAMIARIEQEAPEIWARHRGAPERYAPDGVHNRNALYTMGRTLYDHRAYKDARGYLKIAAQLGSGPAMELLGIQNLNARGTDKDLKEAAVWFRKAADAGEARAAALLCVALDLGAGVEEDGDAALELCSRAAEREDSMGLWYLGSLLRRGRGGPADPVRAEELQKKAETNEDFPRQMYWGYDLHRDDGSYPDPEGAYRISKLALDRGLESVRQRIAYFTRKGIGVAADPVAAAKLYIESAKHGWGAGYFQAALIYARGEGTPRDPARCRDLLGDYLGSGADAAPNDVAWFLVTVDVAELRDPKWALDLARKAVSRSPDSAAYADTLAAVYAELGRWDDAVATQRKAIAIINSKGLDEKVAKPYADHLAEYQAQKPHREKWE